MANLRLHSEFGVNPHLTNCPQCGGESKELVLLGNNDKLYECTGCGTHYIGNVSPSEKCPNCKTKKNSKWVKIRTIGESERLSASEPCGKCKKLNAEVEAEVKAGGVFWKCEDCHSMGALRADSEMARAIREHTKIFAPDPVGITFSKTVRCPVCSAEAVDKQ